MVVAMAAAAKFLHFASAADLRAGDARALQISGIGVSDDSDDTVIVVLDADDNVRRIHNARGQETNIMSWPVRQVLLDLLDPQD